MVTMASVMSANNTHKQSEWFTRKRILSMQRPVIYVEGGDNRRTSMAPFAQRPCECHHRERNGAKGHQAKNNPILRTHQPYFRFTPEKLFVGRGNPVETSDVVSGPSSPRTHYATLQSGIRYILAKYTDNIAYCETASEFVRVDAGGMGEQLTITMPPFPI